MPTAHQFPGFANTFRDVHEEPEWQPTFEDLALLEAHVTDDFSIFTYAQKITDEELRKI